MLLRKKILILAIILLLILPISYAQVCEVGKIKQVLRKILYLYFTEPGSISLSKEEVKDLLVFYLSISAQNLTADCSVLGTNSNKPIFDVMTTGENLPERIPSCADGTKYGECSKFRPAYCYAGVLYQKCDLCGCPLNSVCGKAHKCEPLVQNITCFKDIDCGQNAFVGDYYCTGNYITRNYLNYSCNSPGTVSSSCVSYNYPITLSYCNPSLNQACVNGYATCQANATNQTTQLSGACLVRGGSTSIPLATAPDFGIGYSKKHIVGVNDVIGLRSACTLDIYKSLLYDYCKNNSLSTAFSVVTYKSDGTLSSFGGSNYNDIYSCSYLNQTTALPGICLIRDQYTSVPNFYASDFGIGYAKMPKSGVYNLSELKNACTENDFRSLLQNYCTSNSNPVTEEVVNFFQDGSHKSSTCGAFGCASYNCAYLSSNKTPTGVCMIRDKYTSTPGFFEPDFGIGYAKIAKPGINTISGLQSSCTQADYNSLLQSYCASNTNPVQQQVVTYGPGGGYNSSSCGAFGCNYVNCSQATNQTNQCTDSDGGINYYLKGIANNGSAYNYTDYCGTGNNLFENYCDSNGKLQTNYLYVCPNGCSNGACINATVNATTYCVDSDGGLNYFVFGSISWYGTNWGSYIDYCLGNTLYEANCQNVTQSMFYYGQGLWKSYQCPSGCLYGACVVNQTTTSNQTGLKALGMACTSGTQCSSGYCVSAPLDNTVGNCTYYGGDTSVIASTCTAGYYPSLPCQCGSVAIYASACNSGIQYWPPTQGGNAVGAYCAGNTGDCKTGICYLNLCSYAVKCSPSTPGYCHDHAECVAYGASC